MTTDEMLIEIVSYKYKSHGFPYVFLDYEQFLQGEWHVTWRNPVEFNNNEIKKGSTPHEACVNALEFINNNKQFFEK